MIRNKKILPLVEPRMVDDALMEIQTILEEGLEWLDKAYGRAVRRKELKDGKVVMYPAIQAGGEEYVSMFPDGSIGNYSFFDVKDGVNISNMKRGRGDERFKFGLVFWYDLRKVYPDDWESRNEYNVIGEVMDLLNTKVVSKSQFRLNTRFLREESVYSGYTISELDFQFYMMPYGGFRLEGDLIVLLKNVC